MAGLIFLLIGVAQFIKFQFMAWKEEGTPFTAFVDLCTTANVSVLLFKEHNRGYCICGQAPWRKSDIPLDWL